MKENLLETTPISGRWCLLIWKLKRDLQVVVGLTFSWAEMYSVEIRSISHIGSFKIYVRAVQVCWLENLVKREHTFISWSSLQISSYMATAYTWSRNVLKILHIRHQVFMLEVKIDKEDATKAYLLLKKIINMLYYYCLMHTIHEYTLIFPPTILAIFSQSPRSLHLISNSN